jgi:hypothetical protein
MNVGAKIISTNGESLFWEASHAHDITKNKTIDIYI